MIEIEPLVIGDTKSSGKFRDGSNTYETDIKTVSTEDEAKLPNDYPLSLSHEASQEKNEIPSNLDRFYSMLLQEEALEVDKNEVIRVPLLEGSLEYKMLLDNGIDEQTIRNGSITKGELINAGFVFLNRIGDGEKPIFNITINDIDFGDLRLLTEKQLEVIKSYQNEHPALYGTQGQSIEDIRKDMISLLNTAVAETRKDKLHSGDVQAAIKINQQTGLPVTPLEGDLLEWKEVPAYLSSLPKRGKIHQETSNPFFHENISGEPNFLQPTLVFLENECADIWTQPGYDFELNSFTIRGHTFGVMPTRIQAIKGAPSPFLDSGFHFNDNYDLTVVTSQGIIRINSVTLHLLSQGLSETGNGTSGDQHYATTGEYLREFYTFDNEQRERLHEDEEVRRTVSTEEQNELILRKIQRRLLEKAHVWTNNNVVSALTRENE